MYREANRLARTDALTGLPNRRAFEERADQFVAEYHRYHTPCSIVVFDLDHFKQVNDKFGHSAGDRILKGIAPTLRPLLRASDILARWGGEEFVVALPHMPLEQAVVAADRIRQAIASMKLKDASSVPLPAVTASLGIASLEAMDFSPETVIERADRALYQAKAGGRNQTFSLVAQEHAPAV
jgi:diguanylate cyclase (GGDEF)-like protein